jgi:hypothetical protein
MIDPTNFLIGLWLFVGGVISTILCLVVGWRNGFHFRSQEVTTTHLDGSRSTERVDSTLKWMLVVATCFMGPQAFLLGSGAIADALYTVAATVAEFWWVPLLITVLAVTISLVIHFARNTRQEALGADLPAPQPVPVQVAAPIYGALPYGQHGDGGLGVRPKG